MLEFWNERYKKDEYAYGIEPNVFFKSIIDDLHVGKILLPAEGEGRNAVYAASIGWETFAFDLSTEGRTKALKLAESKNVHIDYFIGSFGDLPYQDRQFDAIALIYAHFQSDKKSSFHKTLQDYLKPGGHLIFEAFSKNHLAYNSVNDKVGGPRDEAMLYSVEELKRDFSALEISYLKEEVIHLSEGACHIGMGSVVRMVAVKS